MMYVVIKKYIKEKEGEKIFMSNFIEKCNKKVYMFVAFVIFSVGVFTVNSACNLIFYQPKESENLKRFCKK